MTSNCSSNLFDSLSGLGFNNLNNIPLYNSNDDSKEKPKVVNQTKIEDYLFERKVECPVCYKQISVPSVKSVGVRILSRDSDFMTYYRDPNPMFYDAWVCTSCGYAALSTRFNTISDKQKKLIKENITPKWDCCRTFPLVHDVDIAIQKHQLALLNTVIKMGRDSEKAMTCLKLAWLYRLKKDQPNELKFIDQAVHGFISALEKEPAPIAGLDEPSLEYLIGEIYRRLGDNSSAIQWFSRVLGNRLTKPKIKDMARDQKDIIREQQSKLQTI